MKGLLLTTVLATTALTGIAQAQDAGKVFFLLPNTTTIRFESRDALGLSPADFDVIELNEAFASQGLATLRRLGIADDDARVNRNGGAIALGHPLGMSGGRITGTAALEMSLTGGKRSLSTMCIGVGQGIAMALERV